MHHGGNMCRTGYDSYFVLPLMMLRCHVLKECEKQQMRPVFFLDEVVLYEEWCLLGCYAVWLL
jgi:hypothetical protein